MHIAVVIPAFKAQNTIADVIGKIPDAVKKIYVVDDASPDDTYHSVEALNNNRVTLLRHADNKGVGGAMITGYKQAFQDGADIVVKIDSDGQMDPSILNKFTNPIQSGLADYTKGNRFYYPDDIQEMPFIRRVGNLGLSFITKLSSGYWDLFDPTNGYTALHKDSYELLQIDKISQRYFFETDMLFRLNIIGAVAVDIPMKAVYGNETSHLSSAKSLVEFSIKHLLLLTKRVAYKYYLRDFNVGSIELLFGTVLFSFGLIFGLIKWLDTWQSGIPATAGTVMAAALPIILGFQLLLNFVVVDSTSRPNIPLQKRK